MAPDVNCPWCEFQAGPRALHAHLGERHRAEARTAERNGKVFYQISCPVCGSQYERLLRKGSRDPAFLTEFGPQIQMVALDMLVHHLMAEHAPDEQQRERTREHGHATGQ